MSYTRMNYQETEVLTAPPQKLRLMLIQAAIRSIEQTRRHWHAGDNDHAFETLVHAQEIVTELLSGFNPEVSRELTSKVSAIYLFVFRSLIEANLHRSEAKLDDAVRVLKEEQETWRQLCEMLADTGRHSAVDVSLREPSEPHAPPVGSVPVLDLDLPGEASAGFCLEA